MNLNTKELVLVLRKHSRLLVVVVFAAAAIFMLIQYVGSGDTPYTTFVSTSDPSTVGETTTVEGQYTGFYDFPNAFFEESSLSPEEVVSVTDAQYLALKDMHNGNIAYDFARIEYEPTHYGSTMPNGIKLGDAAFPGLYSGHHRWEVMSHEQGHNFFGRNYFYITLAVPGPFMQESFAVLSAFYTYRYILDNQHTLGLNQEIIDSLNFDFSNGREGQEGRYNQYIAYGKNFGMDDILTSQTLDYKMIVYGETYGWDNYKKFTRAFENSAASEFIFQYDGLPDPERSTYVIAALGVAFGQDFRAEFRDLNFPIDDNFYNYIKPILEHIMDLSTTAPTISFVKATTESFPQGTFMVEGVGYGFSQLNDRIEFHSEDDSCEVAHTYYEYTPIGTDDWVKVEIPIENNNDINSPGRNDPWSWLPPAKVITDVEDDDLSIRLIAEDCDGYVQKSDIYTIKVDLISNDFQSPKFTAGPFHGYWGQKKLLANNLTFDLNDKDNDFIYFTWEDVGGSGIDTNKDNSTWHYLKLPKGPSDAPIKLDVNYTNFWGADWGFIDPFPRAGMAPGTYALVYTLKDKAGNTTHNWFNPYLIEITDSVAINNTPPIINSSSQTQSTINWTLNPNGFSNLTHYWAGLYKSTDCTTGLVGAWFKKTSANPTSFTSFPINNLAPGTWYSLAAVSCRAASDCSEASCKAIKTTDADVVIPIPGTPNLYSPAQTGPGWLKWTWSAVSNVHHYKPYIGNSCSPLTTDNNQTATTYTRSGLGEGVSKSFRVKACNSLDQCSNYSGCVTGTTPSEDLPVPTKPVVDDPGLYGRTSIDWSWTNSGSNVTYHWRLYTDGSTNPRCLVGDRVQYDETTSRRVTTENLQPNTYYAFRLKACNANNQCSLYSDCVKLKTLN